MGYFLFDCSAGKKKTAEFLVENYITHDSAEKSPLIRESKWYKQIM